MNTHVIFYKVDGLWQTIYTSIPIQDSTINMAIDTYCSIRDDVENKNLSGTLSDVSYVNFLEKRILKFHQGMWPLYSVDMEMLSPTEEESFKNILLAN